jgi:hypothetical protein
MIHDYDGLLLGLWGPGQSIELSILSSTGLKLGLNTLTSDGLNMIETAGSTGGNAVTVLLTLFQNKQHLVLKRCNPFNDEKCTMFISPAPY